MKLGVDPGRIEILAVGEYKNYRGQVHAQTPAPGTEISSDTPIVLEVGYPSAVDWMPYQFYYGLGGLRDSNTTWEDNARRMMAPFDAAVVRYNAIAHFEDMKYQLAFVHENQLKRFNALFDFIPNGIALTLEEMLRWAVLLPTFHDWSGNAEKTAQVLSSFFGLQFTIVENTCGTFEIPKELRYHLGQGQGRLGRKTIVGKSFTEYDSSCEVIISGIKSKRVEEYLPGRKKRKKLDWMLKICLPGNFNYRLSFRVTDRQTRVGDRESGGLMGYTSYLGRTREVHDNKPGLAESA